MYKGIHINTYQTPYTYKHTRTHTNMSYLYVSSTFLNPIGVDSSEMGGG
jgi:hypothetical protein